MAAPVAVPAAKALSAVAQQVYKAVQSIVEGEGTESKSGNRKIDRQGKRMVQHVNSRAIQQISYQPDLDSMFIRFKNKGGYPNYQYFDVPAELFAAFVASHSKGKFFHRHVKGRY